MIETNLDDCFFWFFVSSSFFFLLICFEKKEEIKRGLVQVDGEMVSYEKRFESNECMQHRIHRHEPPVTGDEIKVVYKDDMVVAIDKPGSIPVHPTGRYRHNTVMFILAKESGIKNLYPVHRLDKLTSGLLLFARNPQRAEKIAEEIRSERVSKTYLARVIGEFPGPQKIICKDPILLSVDIGMRELNKVHPDGKACETHFRRLFFDGNHSLVKCKPKTGRTHQIRVHLAHLGHPIVNDPLYNPEYRARNAEPWELAMVGSGEDENDSNNMIAAIPTIEGLNKKGEGKEDVLSSSSQLQAPTSSTSTSTSSYIDSFDPKSVAKINVDDADPAPICHLCPITWRMPKPHELYIFLHALSYKGEDFFYETQPPAWALQSFQWTDHSLTNTNPIDHHDHIIHNNEPHLIDGDDTKQDTSLKMDQTHSSSS
jgi:RluA family pseudouridine synthase